MSGLNRQIDKHSITTLCGLAKRDGNGWRDLHSLRSSSGPIWVPHFASLMVRMGGRR